MISCIVARVLTTVIVLSTCLAAEAFPPPFYSAKEIRASVVDEATGQPIQGVVVVAQWVLERLGGGRKPTLQVTEALTDTDGRFVIPAWGPRARPPFSELWHHSPQLLLFKSGYAPLRLSSQSKASFAAVFPNHPTMSTKAIAANIKIGGDPDSAVQDSVWDGLAIQLEPFRGAPDQWAEWLRLHLEYIREGDARHARRLFEAVRAEREYFRAHPVSPGREYLMESLFDHVDRLLR